MEGAILFFSRFPASAGGGGGARREAQLVELLLPLGFRFLSCWDSEYMKGRAKRRASMASRLTKKLSPNRKYWVDDDSWDYVFDLGAIAREWLDRFGSLQNIRMVILDDPIYFSPLAVHFHQRGIPLVALCQNLESLSLGQLNRKHQFRLLQKEIALLKKCSLVVGISREETFLLRNMGMPVVYLPYYPVHAIQERLGKVRENRIHSRKEGYLVLGTAGNKATLDGMRALIEFWGSPRNSLREEKLLVAGFWTRKYLPSAPAGNVIILGDITDAGLDDLLGTVKALVCFQESGSGALTKIREMLLAGVPVLANSHAARSYHEFNGAGLFEFAGLEDLGRAAAAAMAAATEKRREQFAPPPMPASLAAAKRDLLARLTALSAGDGLPAATMN
jgi:hypothetical protein